MRQKSLSQRIPLPLVLLFGFLFIAAAVAAERDPWLRPDVAPAPPENQLTPARVHLGQLLFFDPRLSRKMTMSCASCHNPSLGWSDGLPTAVGFDMHTLARATPTIVNASFNSIQMWDGRKSTLEDQATGPIEAAGEMNSTCGFDSPKQTDGPIDRCLLDRPGNLCLNHLVASC